ncbi:AAA family ATPase [Streptosporangium sp. NPDC000396]|uniref:helix-turn-helix transcriptional regulator n=1 Tax=Streptosporangium sp. NPDC000396 TaxID=3366185 RepID=UPI00368368A0
MGRDRELCQLSAVLSHPPVVVLIEGEAGIGKTRLLRELRHPMLTGCCHPMCEPFPYGPIVEALRVADPPRGLNPVTGALRPLLPEYAHRLPLAPPPLQDPQVERHRLFRAVLSLLDSLSPVTLVVEDVHWVDSDTRELLSFLARCLPDAVNLVLTYRAEDLPVSYPVAAMLANLPPGVGHAEMSLAPLSPEETALLAKHLLPDPPDLWELTTGVPFMVEELARMLAERPGRELRTPPAVRDAVLLRLGTLSAAARRLVQAAAVLDAHVPERALIAVAGVPPEQGERALAEALRRALLRERTPGTYGLRHPLTRQAIYESITPAIRRRLHRRVDTPAASPEGAVSPREDQVIRLAADGLTNREIAESLFLSPRTVEVHVANALRKLGLSSRRQFREHLAKGTT